jgi:hypothetical protein
VGHGPSTVVELGVLRWLIHRAQPRISQRRSNQNLWGLVVVPEGYLMLLIHHGISSLVRRKHSCRFVPPQKK